MPMESNQAPDDIERLIQEVLSELGYSGDAASIARKVKRLNLGLPAEDEFSVICAWLGRPQEPLLALGPVVYGNSIDGNLV
jgi:hypothetical protein